MSHLRETLLAGLLALMLAVPSASLAAPSAGGVAPSAPPAPAPQQPASNGGGTSFGDKTAKPKKRAPKRRRARNTRPVLELFKVSGKSFYDGGPGARVVFRIRSRAKTVRVKLLVRRAGERTALRTIDLGDRPTGGDQSARVDGAALPEGTLELRISARDRKGRGLRRGAHASGVDRIELHRHRFPLAGPFNYGGDGSLFGAARTGHTHQGQDLAAGLGTPIVAPHAGTVTVVGYQASSAGNYVVLDSAGENRDYVFMHLQTGTTVVKVGQQVRTGQLLGKVGSTGSSTGPHLHFEIWEGEWHDGGHPIDPLPHLKRWDSWS